MSNRLIMELSMFNIFDKADNITKRKLETLRKAPKKAFHKSRLDRANNAMVKRQAENKAAYDKAMKVRADYAKFQARRIHNTINGVLPEGARHG
jgi:hypothetical protein